MDEPGNAEIIEFLVGDARRSRRGESQSQDIIGSGFPPGGRWQRGERFG